LVETYAEEYFSGLRAGTLRLPRCSQCERLVWQPRTRCPWCMSADLRYEDLSGRGTVYSYTINHRGQGRYADSPPFAIAYVELAEGPRVLAHLVDWPLESIQIGAEVVLAATAPVDGESPRLRFTLARP
jgi:uncharacterized OB-fold protein